MEDWALFFHLLGAFTFFSGAMVAAVAYEAARRRPRPSEVAVLLRLTRIGVLLVGVGGIVVLAFGLWLVALEERHDYGDGWITGALTLLFVAFALGAVGGRRPKRARLLAERLASEGDESVSEDLRRLLDDVPTLVVNYVTGAIVIAIIVLMVWKPG